MKRITAIIVLMILNTLGLLAQGVYFDSLYHQNDQLSVLAQIFEVDSGYTVIGLHGPGGNPRLEMMKIDDQGISTNIKSWGWDNPTSSIYWYGKGFLPLVDGDYLWSTGFSGPKTAIIKFDENLDTLFKP